jgi:uncharacterized protein (DUF2249 family)
VSADPDVVGALTHVLVRACRALADAGRPDEAGRLAADAWVVVRGGYPRQALHLDGAMHYIARHDDGSNQRNASPQPRLNLTRKVIRMTVDEQILDVRDEIPRRRHELIFRAFTGLAPGDTYVLVNDHDPKPLRYQFEAENAGEFTWQDLEEGPEVWRVRIGRKATAGRSASAWPDWRDAANYSADGPGIRVLSESSDLKVVLVTLGTGQALPAHPGPAACFHILDGTGSILVDDDEITVSAGSTVIAPPGSRRSVRASTPLVFLGNLGDPAAEGTHP